MSNIQDTLADNPGVLLRSIIQRIATGPELSKDISREEACAAMRAILDGEIDDVQAAIFFIALRMKRETDDENSGVLQALRDVTETATADVDDVVVISDPYNGYNRTLPASPFLPAVLAACGVPTVSEGVEFMGPKYGLTHHQVLRAAGVAVDLSSQQAADSLADESLGWAYVDQKNFCPKVHDLAGLRKRIVKRPVLTTVEVLTGPVRGKKRTHLVTGYVHKPYPRRYALMAREMDFDSCLLVRGVEGGIVPSLRQAGKCVYYHDKGPEQELDTDPVALGINQTLRAAPIPEGLPESTDTGEPAGPNVDMRAFAKAAVDSGLAALAGKPGVIHDGLVYSGALVLHHLGHRESMSAAADQVREAINSGQALQHFRQAVTRSG